MTRPFDARSKFSADYLAAFAMMLAPVIYFLPALLHHQVLSPDDGVIFNVPLRVTAANLIRQGYLPLWNPYIFCGMPLYGAAQAGLLFPPNWFYFILSPRVATNLMMLSAYALAALGAYLYARRAGADIAGAIATSLVWQWSAFLIEQIGHTNILHTAAMLPWVLWAIDGYIATGARWRGVLLAALLAIQMFAGHQQTFTYSLVLTCAYAFVMARASKKPRKSYVYLAVMILAGLALAAVQILPTLELLRNSLRATATYDFFSSFSMPPRFVLTFFAPYVLGGGNGILFRAPYIGPIFFSEYVAYTGVLTIMLSVAGLILRRDARTKFWAAVFVISLALAFGRYLPFNLYKLIYHVPLLGLFRDPARHVMEVEFALAVLAGRGLTAITTSLGERKRVLMAAAIAAGAIFLLTCLAVTWWRPAAFRLARDAPVSVLRAPELFVPIFMAAISAWTLWRFARSGRRGALVLLLAVLAFDLIVYGQGSGWRTHSPTGNYELWGEPAAIKFLRERESSQFPADRILSEDLHFDPELSVPSPTPAIPSPSATPPVLSLQPDTFMMHGIYNAAGYDGFGLARYSHLAGDMKVWGELGDADRSLRGEGREIDLLNVRYLLTQRGPVVSNAALSSTASAGFPQATKIYGGQRFGETDLPLPGIKTGESLSFNVPPIEIDRIALLTNLAWSNDVSDHTAVAHIRLRAEDGQTFEFELRAGDHSSEWAYDRPDIRSRIKHRRAPVATSQEIEDAQGKYEAHTYVCAFNLPRKILVTSGAITTSRVERAPDLILNVARITLADGDRAFPLSELMRKEAETESAARSSELPTGTRWKKVTELSDVAIFENTRMLPRAWLAIGVEVLSEAEMLGVIRTGKLPKGQPWEPRRVALIEHPVNIETNSVDDAASAEIAVYEPNRVIVRTRSATPTILVLGENHYPGWRAYVDDQNVDVLRVDYELRGVQLPAGTHEVRFVYRPKSVLIGFSISLLTALALTAWSLRLWPSRKLRR